MEASLIAIDPLSSNVCRCCLLYFDEPMDSLFDIVYDNIQLHEILKLLASPDNFYLSFDDGYSQSICESCKSNAIEAFSFRQSIIASNERVHSFHFSEEENFEQVEVFEEEVMEMEALEPSFEIKENDDVELFACPLSICGESFKDSQELALHSIKNHELNNGEGSFVCAVCPYVCTTQADMDTHTENHTTLNTITIRGRKHECQICTKRFETPSKLNRHLMVHRDVLDISQIPPRPVKSYKYECALCQKRVETPSKLQRHMRVHDRSGKFEIGINQHRPVACQHCDMRFWDSIRLDRHQIIHSSEFEQSKINHKAGHMFTCVICLASVPDYDDCIEHMKNHRDDVIEGTEVSCALCSKSYPKLTNLVRHSRTHIENATHQCIYCSKKMGMGDDLIDHMLRHKGFKPFTCNFPTCGKGFLKHNKLRQHMVTHEETAEKSFSCDQCDKTFTEADYLKRHLLRHSGKKSHACTVCPSRFTFKTELASHMTTHSTVKPFTCDLCPNKFSKMQALRTHQKTHSGDKKFVCGMCSMRFVTSNNLRRHMRSHTGIKPYECSHCSKAYGQSNDLMKHMQTHVGPNVYRCDIGDCTEAFEKFSELKNHKILHYNSDETMIEESYEEDIDTMKML